MKIKIATAQINYLPTVTTLDEDSGHLIEGEKSPFLYNEISELNQTYSKFKEFERKYKRIENFGNLINSFSEGYIKTLNSQINKIINICKSKSIDLVVFPEYSIPIESLDYVNRLSKENDIVIIAGSHTLTQENLDNYFFNELLSVKEVGSFDYLAICPVFTPNDNQILIKQFSSRYDDNLNELNDDSREIITIRKGDKSYKIGITICKEFLPTLIDTIDFIKFENILKSIQEADIIVIVSLNKNSKHFREKTNEFLNERRHGGRVNIIYSNYSLFGGSYIQCKGEKVDYPTDVTEELLIVREVFVGTGGGASYAKPPKSSERISILPETNFFKIIESAIEGIEEKEIHEEIFELSKRNLPPAYKNIIKIMANHINAGTTNKDRLKKLVYGKLLLLNKSESISYFLAEFFEEIKKYIDKTFDPNWEVRYDNLISKLNPKLRKLREHGVVIAYSENQNIAYPELSNLNKLKDNEEHRFKKFVTSDEETQFNFCIRVTSSPSENIGIAYQLRLITQLIDILKNLRVVKFIEYRFITTNTYNNDDSHKTEILLLFGFDYDSEDTLITLCQEMFIAVNLRLIGVSIEPVEVDSIWFKDFVISKTSSNKKFINPKVDNNGKRHILKGRGEVSNIIKVLSTIKGINIYSLRIYKPNAKEKGYEIIDESPTPQLNQGINTGVISTLRDLQDLQEASNSFQFQHPLYSPSSISSTSPEFRCSIWVQTENSLNNSNLLIQTIAHEISGVGRYQVSDTKDKNFKVCEKELYHLLRFPFGKIPGFSKKSFGKQLLAFDDNRYEVPNEGIYLGDIYLSREQTTTAFHWEETNRDRHAHIIGKTGTGKSYFLASMISNDIIAGGGLMVIDPHGDLIDLILPRIPLERRSDIIFFDPGDTNFAPGLNIFEADYEDEAHKSFVIEEAVSILLKLYGGEIFGPRIQHYFREGVTSLMEFRRKQGDFTTLIDLSKLFVDEEFRDQVRHNIADSGISQEFWLMFQNQGSRERNEMLPYFQSKFAPLVSNYILNNIVGQKRSILNFEKIIDDKKIVLVNLSKGKLRDINSNLLGMILVSKLNYAIMGRANLHPNERKLFTLYVDEFQNFASSTFASMLSEARKYKLSMVLANQYLNQLKLYDPYTSVYPDSLIESVLGNCGTLLSFRIGNHDANTIASEIQLPIPQKGKNPLIELDNYEAIISTNAKGVKIPPFLLKSRKWDKEDNYDHSQFIEEYKKENCLEVSARTVLSDGDNSDSILKFFDIKSFLEEGDYKDKIEAYQKEIEEFKESIKDEKWYINYVSKFDVSAINLKVPLDKPEKYSWYVLIQLIAASFSSGIQLLRNDEGTLDCVISVKSGDTYIEKTLHELFGFQINSLFKIYIKEMIELEYLLQTDESERKSISAKRSMQISKWNNKIKEVKAANT